MDYKKTPFVLLLLIALLGSGVFWFFNKQPLTKNLMLDKATSEITFYFSETVPKDKGDEGIYYLKENYYVKGTYNDKEIKPILNVMDIMKSRKRFGGQGDILVGFTGMNTINIEFWINDDFYSYTFTDRDNIMRGHKPHTRDVISITLNDGDFETLASLIKHYGELQK